MKKPKSLKITSLNFRSIKGFFGKWYVFPAVLFLLVCLTTALKIHGSSVGMFHRFLYGTEIKDPDLIAGQVRAIRSDEWLSNTPLTVSQHYNNYPTYNQDLGFGHDMTVVKDWADRSWVSLFKIQNWGFFIMPLENAFAFRWAMLSFMLIVAAYLFALELMPGKTKWAILLSLVLYFSPFLHWWYLVTSFGSVAYVLFALVLLMRLHKTNSRNLKMLYSGLLTFSAVSFALILYPPFQISAAFAGLFFYLGFLLKTFDLKDKPQRVKLFRDLLFIGAGGLLAALILFGYYLQHQEVIRAITNSLHPGARQVSSGDRNLEYLVHQFSSQFGYRLQLPRAGLNYWTNQSEAANFILVFPALVLGSLLLIYKDVKKKLPIDYLLIFPIIALTLVLIRQYVHGLDPLFNLFALDRVPNFRIIMALGVAQFLLLASYYRRSRQISFDGKLDRAILYFAVIATFLLSMIFGHLTAKTHTKFLFNYSEIFIISTFLAINTYFLLRAKLAGLVMLALFSFISIAAINPIYRGLKPVYQNELTNTIRSVSSENDTWAVMDSGDFENYAVAAGRPSISGLYSYPREDLWQKAGVAENKSVYNRSAHVLVTLDGMQEETYLKLVAVNRFFVVINPCSEFVDKTNLKFLLSQKPLENKCIEEVDYLEFPGRKFWIYKVVD